MKRQKTVARILIMAFLLNLIAGMGSPPDAAPGSSPIAHAENLGPLQQAAPDLVITDVWAADADICHQIRNVGDAEAPAGHESVLYIDGAASAGDTVTVTMAPGERLNRCFGFSQWQCTSSEDTINICADNQNYITESNDANNCTEESWLCDATPPQIIAGPTASNVLTASAVITWTTDEDSNSMVHFGRYAGKYEGQESSGQLSKTHAVPLTGLQPATVYRYVVESTDASSNTVASREGFFETAAPPTAAPDVSSPTVTRMDGDRELYEITVSVTDTLHTRKVEFYLDGTLIGTDYAATLSPGAYLDAASAGAAAPAPQYQVHLDPASSKMSRTSFFSTQHVVMARAFSLSGLPKETAVLYTPPFELPDIDLRVWPSHNLTRYVDGVGGVLPPGTTIDVSVRATEDEWDCTWVPLTGDMFCGDVEHAVDRVVFKINSTPVYTSYPSDDDDFDHYYTWNVGGLGAGTYHIEARAYARGGGSLGTVRTLTVEPGTPSLDLSRSVTRVGNYFRVRLTLENEGTASAGISHIRDNVSGFQAIMTSTTNYSVVPEYWVETKHCDVEIDVFDGTDPLMLGPGESLDVEYLAVPILYADSDTFEYGAGVRDEVKIWDQGGFCRWRFDQPQSLEESVASARASSDYLIVTHPRNLFRDNAGRRGDVDELLSKMAELAQLKSGILGYVSVSGADSVLDQIVEWGDDMRGSDGVGDHFLSNGYVLLVGEVEILGSWESKHKLWVDGLLRTRTVHYTDLPYGNTSGDWVDPELIVGRVVGNNAAELMTPLQTSINVYHDEPDYHFTKSRALVVSGRGDGVSSFEANVDAVSRLLRSVGSSFAWGSVTTKKQRYVEDTEGLDITWVFTSSIPPNGRDLIYYRDHCGAFGWGDGTTVVDTGHFPLDFGERKPFVFACCCQAGRYEALGARGIAEAFLQNEAGVYIGSTENSRRSQNNEASEWFFDRWADRTESIGQSFRALKRHLDGREGWYWAAEYNLYGDPKYGVVSTLAGLDSRVEVAAAQPITSVSVVVPDYEVTTTIESEYLVRIPGEAGGMLLEEGKPMVPIFYEEIAYAPGYRVQDVALTARSGLTTATGISVTVTSVATDSVSTAPASPSVNGAEWHPPLDQIFDWSVRENPDGSSTLIIEIYPFYYNASTTNVQFYTNYSFTVQVVSSTVQIMSLSTDENVYAQGGKVAIDLSLSNGGDALDTIVSAVVETQAGDVVDGLLLQSLHGLTGTASFSLQWNSAGFEPGYYAIKAEVRDASGNTLDRKMEQFRLGVCAGEISAFTATPTFFDIGDAITISLAFSNTGTIPITGTAVIQVQDETGEVVEELSHEVANLAVGHSTRFDDAWDTSGSAEGSYTAIGYVLYDARATEIETVVVSTEAYIYLPVILRSG